MVSLEVINQGITRCARCPELREYAQRVAREKRRAFADWDYWGRPVASFGDEEAKILIVGLAPAAHGANRTGRMFTGDRSGDFLYAALHRTGHANQPTATHRGDGLALRGVYITASLHCAPPGNKPTTKQLASCNLWLVEELKLLKPRVLLCLGSIAWRSTLAALRLLGAELPRPLPKFGHGAECVIGRYTMLGSYHVSQQNTFTGKLTEAMFDGVLERAAELAG